MADGEDTETEGTDPGETDRTPSEGEHHAGLGGRLHHAEHTVEAALKDAVARVENRMIQAGEAETSASPEVNLASAIEVVLNPPHATDEEVDPKPAASDQQTPPA